MRHLLLQIVRQQEKLWKETDGYALTPQDKLHTIRMIAKNKDYPPYRAPLKACVNDC
jgi:hypothetical protein